MRPTHAVHRRTDRSLQGLGNCCFLIFRLMGKVGKSPVISIFHRFARKIGRPNSKLYYQSIARRPRRTRNFSYFCKYQIVLSSHGTRTLALSLSFVLVSKGWRRCYLVILWGISAALSVQDCFCTWAFRRNLYDRRNINRRSIESIYPK